MENLLKETIQVKVRDMVDKDPETWEKIQYMSKQITIYFKPGISVKRIYEINDLLIATNKIEDIVYISQQDAYDIFSEENKDSPELTELLTPDILPASLEIYVKENDDVEYIKEFIEKFQEDIETTVYGNESYEGIKDIMEGNFKLN